MAATAAFRQTTLLQCIYTVRFSWFSHCNVLQATTEHTLLWPPATGLTFNGHNDQMAAKGARKWGVCGHTFHNISCTFGHFSCEIGGCSFGINKHDRHPARSRNDRSERARIMPKVRDMWVNSLAALLSPISV